MDGRGDQDVLHLLGEPVAHVDRLVRVGGEGEVGAVALEDTDGHEDDGPVVDSLGPVGHGHLGDEEGHVPGMASAVDIRIVRRTEGVGSVRFPFDSFSKM